MMKPGRFAYILIAVPLGVGLLCLLLISFIISSSKKEIYESVKDVPETHAALILGAAVLKSGGLSPVLRDRVDKAIELYEAAKVRSIIASGNSQGVDFDEVEPIRKYLLAAGIPAESIIVDNGGFDTYSSIYRAKDVFQMQSVTIVTQSFHLPRAVFVAKELGLVAYGLSADRGHYKIINYFREMLADVKAAINLATHRTPTYSESENPSEDRCCMTDDGHYQIPIW